jgi:hypothetical protein
LLGDPSSILEFADVGIVWLNAAGLAGFNIEDLVTAMVLKMQINKNRKWGKPDRHGVVEHIR